MGDLDDLARAAAASKTNRQPSARQAGPLPPFPQYDQQRAPQQPPQQQPPYANPQPVYPDVPPPTGVERVWTVHDRGQQFGPHTEIEIAQLLAVGTISTTAMVWRTGSSRWIPVTSIVPMPVYPPPPPNYGHPPPGYPQQQYPTAYPPQNSSNRVAVGVLALFLGAFGIHKFMLGATTPALILLLVTVLTCGYAGVITAIIGIVEGIIILTKTDAQFHQEYVIGKKQWF
jgi:TM2 domain-containing membrane protein YozV